MTVKQMQEALRAKEFLLLHQERCVIQDSASRDQLTRLPSPETVCPVQETFYRRLGIRP